MIEGAVPSDHVCRALILCLLDAFDEFLLRLLPVRTLPLLPRLESLLIVIFHNIKYVHVRLERIENRVIDAEIHEDISHSLNYTERYVVVRTDRVFTIEHVQECVHISPKPGFLDIHRILSESL